MFRDVGSEVSGNFFFVSIPACAMGPDKAVLRRVAMLYFVDLRGFACRHRSAQGARGH